MYRLLFLALLVSFVACESESEDPVDAAAMTINAEDYGERIAILSSDEFEGRAPSSPGEEKTIEYLTTEMEKLGLEPGNRGSFVQDVPLVAITTAPTTMRIANGSATTDLDFRSEFVVTTRRVRESVSVENSDMVFVGYGIVAPEYGWDDYAGVDVSGKTVVILVNDPGFATQDENVFKGNTMTYYGRWTYKYEEAARQGAAAAIIVHETAPASYPWEVVEGGWTGPQFNLVAEDENMSRCAAEGWIQYPVAQSLFESAGLNYDRLRDRAAQPGFTAMAMNATMSVEMNNGIERSNSRNVIGVLPGSERPDEYVFYMAHWDHFGLTGIDEGDGDVIMNGAVDNATGTAAVLEIAEAFTSLPEAPARSTAFLLVTAEEQGLLGSAYYGMNPIYPPEKTAAAINIDAMPAIGPTRDLIVVGLGNSELDDYLREVASDNGKEIFPDASPERGFYFRSDHFSFAKVGIPALYVDSGVDHVEHGREYGLQALADYTANRYHKPSDEYDPETWDLSGNEGDLRIFFRVGYNIANTDDWPNWSEGSEFKAMRDAQMGG